MLTFHEDRRQVWIHRNDDGSLRHEFSFDPSEPLPWRAEVDVVFHDCMPDKPDAAAIDAELDKVHAQLIEANHAWSLDQKSRGVKTITESELLERNKGVVGSTRLQELRRERLFPEPMIAGGRNIWIESEAMEAVARVVARDTEGARKRRAPLNRYQRKK